MSVYLKLAQARVNLQEIEMTKSGFNKFASYRYFELGDFMPHVNRIFANLKLCGFVSYTSETASLTIVDAESGESLVIYSPMAEAQLKGTHPIQNLGAVETYQRRYLWVTAMEIVEHDALDSSEPVKEDLTDYQAKLEEATDMQSLMTVWQSIPKKHHQSLKDVAASVKTKLEKS